MANGTDSTILNPDTYLNHFTPDEAKQFEVSRNVYIAVLGVSTAIFPTPLSTN